MIKIFERHVNFASYYMCHRQIEVGYRLGGVCIFWVPFERNQLFFTRTCYSKTKKTLKLIITELGFSYRKFSIYITLNKNNSSLIRIFRSQVSNKSLLNSKIFIATYKRKFVFFSVFFFNFGFK